MKLKSTPPRLLLPALMLLLAGCGGGNQTSDTPTPLPIATLSSVPPAPTATATPTPTPTQAPPIPTPAAISTQVTPTATPIPTPALTPTGANKPAMPQTSSTEVPFQSVGGLLVTCPTEAEIVRFESDLDLDFSDTNVRPYACLDGVDPDGSNERLATYQALRVMRFLTFDEPPPWTNLSLYDWFK